jgi:hypothetical protein
MPGQSTKRRLDMALDLGIIFAPPSRLIVVMDSIQTIHESNESKDLAYRVSIGSSSSKHHCLLPNEFDNTSMITKVMSFDIQIRNML